jgi:methylthioribose-1-phosphate isomerase
MGFESTTDANLSAQIGTYQAASLAKMHGIDFMVIAPVATLDLTKATGKE